MKTRRYKLEFKRRCKLYIVKFISRFGLRRLTPFEIALKAANGGPLDEAVWAGAVLDEDKRMESYRPPLPHVNVERRSGKI